MGGAAVFETPNRVLVTCRTENLAAVQAAAEKQDCFADVLGTTGGDALAMSVNAVEVVRSSLADLRAANEVLEEQLAAEVVLA